MVLIPFTQLRLGPVGVGEILFFGIALIVFLQGPLRSEGVFATTFQVFLGGLIASSLLSFAINKVLLAGSNDIGIAAFNLLSYLYVLCVISAISSIRFLAGGADGFWRFALKSWQVVFVILFVVSFFVASVGGLTLLQWGRFSPLVNNLHQAAQVTLGMTFISLFFAADAESAMSRAYHVVMSVAFAAMAWLSEASTVKLGFVAGTMGFLFAWLSTTSSAGRREVKVHRVVLLSLLGGIVGLILIAALWSTIEAWFIQADGGSARAIIYTMALNDWVSSPLFGTGPGHAVELSFEKTDTHSAVLSVMQQSGIVGLLFLTFLFFKLLSRSLVSPFLFSTVCSLIPYFVTGEALRRVPLWFMLLAVMVFAERVRASRMQVFVGSAIGVGRTEGALPG